MKKFSSIIFALFSFSTLAISQGGVFIEIRPATSSQVEDYGDALLGIGLGVEGNVGIHFIEQFGIYGGWGLTKITSVESVNDITLDYLERGYNFGFELCKIYKGDVFNLRFFVRAGTAYTNFEVKNDTDEVMTTDNDFGLQTYAGMAIDLYKGLEVTISGKAQRTTHKDLGASDIEDRHVSYISGGVGLRKSF